MREEGREQEVRRKVEESMLGKRIRVEKWKEGREESEKGESVRGREEG